MVAVAPCPCSRLVLTRPVYNSLRLSIAHAQSFLPHLATASLLSTSVTLTLCHRRSVCAVCWSPHTRDTVRYCSPSLQLTLLSMIISRSLLLPQMASFHSFLQLSDIPSCIYAPHLFYPFICQWVCRLFPFLGCCK